MRFSTRSRVSILISLLIIVSVFVLGGVLSQGASAKLATTQPYSVTKGNTSPSTSVDNTSSPAYLLPRGSRSFKTNTGSAFQAPVAPASQFDEGGAGKLLQNFNGTSSLDSAKTNFGAEFEPPDQGLCVGNGFIVEPVNSAYNIYRTNGTKIAGPFNVNKLFNDGFRQFTSDPRCYYDESTNTWFAVILFINSSSTVGRIDLSVNPSGDPTTPWTTYKIDVTDLGNPGCPCFGDQPLLGIDQYNVYVSTNEFSILGTQFNGAQIYAFSKSELVALSQSVHYVHFGNLNIGGAKAASVQPAISYGNPEAEYFLNSIDPNGTGNNRLGIWAMTDRQEVSEGGIPNLSRVVITSEHYGVPPAAAQKGSNRRLDSGDDRMQQVEYINGNLWGELDTIVRISGDSTPRAGAAWFEVHPNLSGEEIGGASIVNQGYIAVKGEYLLYPAIAVSPNNTAAIIMTLSGADFYPSVVYAVKQEDQNSFGTLHIAAFGTGPYRAGTRWGDYSWAVFNSGTDSFWLATEYVPPLSSQTPDRKTNWGTRVLEVSAG